jgi:predicted XRE-type DNA-binding protein
MSVSRLSQQTLADMVGTTRSRVSFFMSRFTGSNSVHF